MRLVEESIDIGVPVATAYNVWTHYEDFPEFIEGIQEIHRLDDAHVHCKTRIAGVELEFAAEIIEQRPHERVAWRATLGPAHTGVATFKRLGDGRTRLTLHIEEELEDATERGRDGVLSRHVRADLGRFKQMLEAAADTRIRRFEPEVNRGQTPFM